MKKILVIVTCVVVIASLMLNVVLALKITPVISDNLLELERTINLHADDPNVIYTISRSVRLKSLANDNYTYTMYKLEPYGYAIVHDVSGALMEACFDSESIFPYELTQEDYYYCGPFSYYVKAGGVLHHTLSGDVLDVSEKINLVATENKAVSLLGNANLTCNDYAEVQSADTSSVSYYVAENYFSNLVKYGSNPGTTCTALAASMLLGYYDEFVNDTLVASNYEDGNGTTNEFHNLICQYVFDGYDISTGIQIYNAVAGLNRYLSSVGASVRFASEYGSELTVWQKIIDELKGGCPVIASFRTSSGEIGYHSVVVYGVTYDTTKPLSEAVAQVHLGWHYSRNGISLEEGRKYHVSMCWADVCGYITCPGEHSHRIWTPVDGSCHSSACLRCGFTEEEAHYEYWDSTTQKCSKCGRIGPIQIIARRGPIESLLSLEEKK